MATAVANNLKAINKIKGATATITRFTDGKSFTGTLVLENDGTTVRVVTGRRGRPCRVDRRLLSSIVLTETEAAHALAEEMASA